MSKPLGKSELTKDDAHDPTTKEYKLSTSVAFVTSDFVSFAIGDVLDLLDASLEANPKTATLKKLVKERLYKLTREIQHQVYYAFGQEPYQLGDSDYIKRVLSGTDEDMLNGTTNPSDVPQD